MSRMCLKLLLLATPAFASGAEQELAKVCSYDHIAEYRSDAVKASFDPRLMKGLWYVNAQKDPAQIGASCQTLNAKEVDATKFVTDFSVLYATWPFTIVEYYESSNASVKGIFRKHVDAPYHIPGGNLLGLPTSVVDFEVSSDGSRYESVVMYSCVGVGVIVNELIVATRSPSIESGAVVMKMVDTAQTRGLPLGNSDLAIVDHTKCESSNMTEIMV